MKTFRDLYLHLNGVDIEQLASSLALHCSPPWQRREDKEDNLDMSDHKALCFESEGGDSDIFPAALFLFPKQKDVWYVSNIVPTVTNELTYDQYNRVLESFLAQVVNPAIANMGVTTELTSDTITIGSVAGADVETALIRFSNLANKSTGSSHPLDRKRWFEFLILANKADLELQVDLVISALIELGWSEEIAYKLGIQFEFAEELLSYVQGR